jgi:arsenate reductase
MSTNILFVCIHNSARSQMAEAFLNRACGGTFAAHSAGIEPGTLNPIVVAAMREKGIDISGRATKSVAAMIASGTAFAYVITVCDEASAERCPTFPGATTRLHWGFPDPAALQGTPAEKLARTRVIRDEIEKKIADWCAVRCPAGQAARR